MSRAVMVIRGVVIVGLTFSARTRMGLLSGLGAWNAWRLGSVWSGWHVVWCVRWLRLRVGLECLGASGHATETRSHGRSEQAEVPPAVRCAPRRAVKSTDDAREPEHEAVEEVGDA